MDLIFRCSCLKAFTPSPPLTPMPCRSDDGCNKIEENPWRSDTPKGAQGQGKTGPKEGVLVPGEWQEPQRWASSTRNRLQLKESRKADAAVKWPRWLPCRHAPEKSAVLRSSCSFFSQLPAAPRHCKALSKLWAREPHICLGHRVNLDNHHTLPYNWCFVVIVPRGGE